MTSNLKRSLLIGPLPPPWGGARVSFNLFYDFLQVDLDPSIIHFDVPIRKNRGGSPPGPVDHKKTVFAIFNVLRSIPRADFVTVFGSRSFCFSYGLIILLVSKLFGKACYFRFFGGRPMLEFVNYPIILTKIILGMLSLADKISLETNFGASEFPLGIQEKTAVVPGYRPRIIIEEELDKPNADLIRFVYVGGITKMKGISVLADAFSSLQSGIGELHLFGAGEAEIINRLENCPGVYFHGLLENNELRRALPTYDVFVFPTTYRTEGHPGVLIEAFMAGLPIITTDVPGINEMVIDGQNGLIVPSGDAGRLVDALHTVATDEELRSRLAVGAEQSLPCLRYSGCFAST